MHKIHIKTYDLRPEYYITNHYTMESNIVNKLSYIKIQ